MVDGQLDENRVWIDGCFDFTHHGHAGAILQARQTIKSSSGTLICGVHNDEDIEFNKGSLPVMNSQERYEHTRANRWCGEVVENAPYVTQPDWLDRYNCQYVVHGDDITLDANGEDCYQIMKDLGRFKVVRRTLGVSTTDIIHRILTGTGNGSQEMPSLQELQMYSSGPDGFEKRCYAFHDDFSNVLVRGDYNFDHKECKFVIGDFDLFHMGQIEQLSAVQKIGPHDRRIIVVITTNDDCIMSLKERALSVLSCKYVDGIVISKSGKKLPSDSLVYRIDTEELVKGGKFAYLTRDVIIQRIQSKRDIYIRRNEKKGVIIS